MTLNVSSFMPQEIADSFIVSLQNESVAGQSFTPLTTTDSEVVIPWAGPASASWVAPGNAITESDPTTGGVTVTPQLLANIVTVQNQSLDDSGQLSNALYAACLTGMVKALDSAVFGPTGSSPAPAGLTALSGVNAIDAGTAWATLDPFNKAQVRAKKYQDKISAFVANEATINELVDLKAGTGSNLPLVTANALDTTGEPEYMLAGAPLRVVDDVADNVVWGVPQRASFLVLRKQIELFQDPYSRSTFYQTIIRIVMRASFAWPNPAAVSKITLS